MSCKTLSALALLVAVVMMNKFAFLLAIAVEVIDGLYSLQVES